MADRSKRADDDELLLRFFPSTIEKPIVRGGRDIELLELLEWPSIKETMF